MMDVFNMLMQIPIVNVFVLYFLFLIITVPVLLLLVSFILLIANNIGRK